MISKITWFWNFIIGSDFNFQNYYFVVILIYWQSRVRSMNEILAVVSVEKPIQAHSHAPTLRCEIIASLTNFHFTTG